MTEPVTQAIGQGREVTLMASAPDDPVVVLAFHGGGGVDGSPAMLVPFAGLVTEAPGVTMALARYRTLNRDGALLDDMRADAAHALEWAVGRLPAGGRLYLMGASFGGLLALDALLAAPAETKYRVAGLILLNAVTDIGPGGFANRVISTGDHAHLSPQDRLAAHPLLSRLRCYIAHGGNDDVVPIDAAHRFAALWPEGRCVLETFPKSSHGFFNRAPHNATVAAALRHFVGATQVATAPDAMPDSMPDSVPDPMPTPTAEPTPEPTPAVKPAPHVARRSLLPDGASMVYGVGAQKAGTSWLFDCLSQSPACHTVPTKELHYFDALYVSSERSHLDDRLAQLRRTVESLTPGTDPDNLKRLRQAQLLAERLSIHATTPGDHRPYVDYMTRGYAGQKIICDFTPSYCALDADGFCEMDSIGPARFIFILRDPVDRLWSQIRMAISVKHPELSDTAYEAKCVAHAKALRDKRDIARISRADYARTMAALESAVPADRIHYAFYETLFSQDSVAAICDFVGIAPVSVAADKRVNLGRSSTMPDATAQMLAEALAPQYDAARARFGASLPAQWRSDVTVTPKTAMQELSEKVVRLGNRLRE